MEFSPFLTLIFLAGIFLPLSSTRKYSAFITAITAWIYPLHTFVVLALAGLGFYIYRKYQRRKYGQLL